MIRHAALVPLSHDHHLGLMAAQRLKRGDAAYPDMEIAASVAQLWQTELSQHFDLEESYLFKLGSSSELRSMIERAIVEHGEMRSLVERISREEEVASSARQLGVQLLDHIRFEEREMFELMQRECTHEDLVEAASAMDQSRSPRVCSNDSAE